MWLMKEYRNKEVRDLMLLLLSLFWLWCTPVFHNICSVDDQNNFSTLLTILESKIGDSLRRKIDLGLAKSNFGIVVISRDFIKKGWTNYELDGLITRSISGEQQKLSIVTSA